MRVGPNEGQMVYPNRNYCTYQVWPQALHLGRQVHKPLHGKSQEHFVKVCTWHFGSTLRVCFFLVYLWGYRGCIILSSFRHFTYIYILKRRLSKT